MRIGDHVCKDGRPDEGVVIEPDENTPPGLLHVAWDGEPNWTYENAGDLRPTP